MKRALLVLLFACGDNHPEIEVFEPTNGTRLTIEQYQFDDGTRLVQPTAFYDRRIHARCTPQEWIDGVTRCVPDAEEAFYRDETCETLFGRATKKFPTHFIARDIRPDDTARWPARVFAVGAKDDPIAQYYRREGTGEDGMPICTGPFPSPIDEEGTQYYELAGEVGGEDLVPITETEIGDGRLGLVVRRSDDGAVVPLGFRDRELDIACAPVPRGDGGACQPIDAPPAELFADNSCTTPAYLADADTEPPAVASTRSPDGCLGYHAVQTEPVARAYRDTGTGCIAVPTSLRVLPLGPPIELAVVERTVDTRPKHRVQRILASEGELHVYADRMFDTATRAECVLQKMGTALRCVPTTLAPIVRVFQPGCTVERRLAEVPLRACEPFAFAANPTGETLEIHAIGDPFDGTAYTFGTFGTCVPYTPPSDRALYDVGPLLPDETFVGAVPFGAR